MHCCVERKFVTNVQIMGHQIVTNCNNVTNVITGASKANMTTELFSCPPTKALWKPNVAKMDEFLEKL